MFEEGPRLKTGLAALNNVVLVPHISSATMWTRQGMAVLASTNTAVMIMGYPVWGDSDVSPFRTDDPPKAVPSIVNAKELDLPECRSESQS